MQRTDAPREADNTRHAASVRLTHWIVFATFLALLVTGIEILISHPRFYWGETGNVNMQPLFSLHIPSSRDTVPTGYGVLPDQNGWSRYLHFQAAWGLVLAGLFYVLAGIWSGHFRKDLVPPASDRSLHSYRRSLIEHLRGRSSPELDSYNLLQRTVYLGVIFVLFPFIVWTGLAMSPAIASAMPWAVSILGGRQSARTLHFLASDLLLLFFFVHVVMVSTSGFRSRIAAMVTGRSSRSEELV